MFVSNLTAGPIGIDGVITLKPSEKNRFIEDTKDLTERVSRLAKLNMVSVTRGNGLEKNGIPNTNVKAATALTAEEKVIDKAEEDATEIEKAKRLEQLSKGADASEDDATNENDAEKATKRSTRSSK